MKEIRREKVCVGEVLFTFSSEVDWDDELVLEFAGVVEGRRFDRYRIREYRGEEKQGATYVLAAGDRMVLSHDEDGKVCFYIEETTEHPMEGVRDFTLIIEN